MLKRERVGEMRVRVLWATGHLSICIHKSHATHLELDEAGREAREVDDEARAVEPQSTYPRRRHTSRRLVVMRPPTIKASKYVPLGWSAARVRTGCQVSVSRSVIGGVTK